MKQFETGMKVFDVLARWGMAAVAFLMGISAVLGGSALIITDGLGIPLEKLEGSIFSSFFWPAVILIVIVGGTQLVATLAYAFKKTVAPELLAVAGFGMMIWIFTEVYIMGHGQLLQASYFFLGISQVVMAGLWVRQISNNVAISADPTKDLVTDKRQREKRDRLQAIFDRVREKGAITNDQVEKLTGVSDATATRYLQELEDKGILEQEGKAGKTVKYSLKR